MTANEALRAREQLGMSVEDLAADLGLTPDVVRGWETGTVRVPGRAEKQLTWELAAHERRVALLESGLPGCEWIASWNQEEIPEDLKAQTAHMERAVAHSESCNVCKAREEFLAERFGEMPKMPVSGRIAAAVWIGSRVERLPKWGQPAVFMALAFGAYSMLKIIFLVPSMLRNPRLIGTAVLGLTASIAIGASLGLAYGGFIAARRAWAK